MFNFLKNVTVSETKPMKEEIIKEIPMGNWKEDRNFLRKIARENKLTGELGTFVYTLISHMRGKSHMRTYKKYSGGWRKMYEVYSASKNLTGVSPEYSKAYSTCDNVFYLMIRIETLEDQAEWIKRHMKDGYEEIAERILNSKY